MYKTSPWLVQGGFPSGRHRVVAQVNSLADTQRILENRNDVMEKQVVIFKWQINSQRSRMAAQSAQNVHGSRSRGPGL